MHRIDFEPSHRARTFSAYSVMIDEEVRWIAWCDHCEEWHWHTPGSGHRFARCEDSSSPYARTGYNLTYAGLFKGDVLQPLELQIS